MNARFILCKFHDDVHLNNYITYSLLNHQNLLVIRQPSTMKIKCVTYSRHTTSIPIYTVNKQPQIAAIATDAEKMPTKIKALRTKIGEREKLRAAYGVWYATHDQNDICYAVCTTEDYPERHAFALIARLQDKVGEIDHCEYEMEENIKLLTQKVADDLAQQYNDLDTIDNVKKTVSQVQMLDDTLAEGIKKLTNNQSNLTEMDDKALKNKSYSNQFHRNAENLQKILYWRNCKLKILITLCIMGFIGFIILVIVMGQQQNEEQTKKMLRRMLRQ